MEIKTSVKTKIVFNGHEYGSVDEMPEEVRRLYRDVIALAAKGGLNIKRSSKTEFKFNDKVYKIADEMPPDVRLAYDTVMKKIDANQHGIPDAFERGRPADASPRRSLFSVVSMVSLIILIAWLVVIILRRV